VGFSSRNPESSKKLRHGENKKVEGGEGEIGVKANIQ